MPSFVDKLNVQLEVPDVGTLVVDTAFDGVKTGANTVVIKPAKLDRSPCGTGASARMAVLHANGKLAIGEPYKATSIIGSAFNCRLLSETRVGDRTAVNPSIAGTAYITGMHQHMLDPSDPCPTR